jgi:uncharacterized membrane protein YoaK (UPF0700 family)
LKAPDTRLLLLLAVLTLVTGFVDAVSYLGLGHVFVANMTGNIVLLGFAFAGVGDISIPGSLVALGAFLLGAVLSGRLIRRHGDAHLRLLSVTTAAKIVLFGIASLCAWLLVPSDGSRYAIAALLGISMGLQNAVVRKIAIPDITTTVLTMTLTGIAADSTFAGGSNTRLGRRLSAVLVMFLGALIGGALVLHVGAAAALAAAVVLLIVVSGAAALLSR